MCVVPVWHGWMLEGQNLCAESLVSVPYKGTCSHLVKSTYEVTINALLSEGRQTNPDTLFRLNSSWDLAKNKGRKRLDTLFSSPRA